MAKTKIFDDFDKSDGPVCKIAVRIQTDFPTENSSYYLDRNTILILFFYLSSGNIASFHERKALKLSSDVLYDVDLERPFVRLSPRFNTTWKILLDYSYKLKCSVTSEKKGANSDFLNFIENRLKTDETRIDVGFTKSLPNDFSIDFIADTFEDFIALTDFLLKSAKIKCIESKESKFGGFSAKSNSMKFTPSKIQAAMMYESSIHISRGESYEEFESDTIINGIQCGKGNFYISNTDETICTEELHLLDRVKHAFDSLERVIGNDSLRRKKKGIDIFSSRLSQGPIYSFNRKCYVYQYFYYTGVVKTGQLGGMHCFEVPINEYTFLYLEKYLIHSSTPKWTNFFNYLRQYFNPDIKEKFQKQTNLFVETIDDEFDYYEEMS